LSGGRASECGSCRTHRYHDNHREHNCLNSNATPRHRVIRFVVGTVAVGRCLWRPVHAIGRVGLGFGFIEELYTPYCSSRKRPRVHRLLPGQRYAVFVTIQICVSLLYIIG
jgi:hypothetical protein